MENGSCPLPKHITQNCVRKEMHKGLQKELLLYLRFYYDNTIPPTIFSENRQVK